MFFFHILFDEIEESDFVHSRKKNCDDWNMKKVIFHFQSVQLVQKIIQFLKRVKESLEISSALPDQKDADETWLW